MAKSIDLTDQRFGKLVVIEKMPETQERYCLWRCRCDCGGEILVNTKRLKRGTITNCGCTYSHLNNILSNEIYIGDRRLQKCYVADPIKHNKVKNRGELPQYYISDCHEPIVGRETFAKVQEILKARAESVPVYPFSRKLKCGICGQNFTRKKGTVKGKTYIHWICRSKKEVGRTCRSVNFSEDELEKISALVLGLDAFDGEVFEEQVRMVKVLPDGGLEFHFSDGGIRRWENLRLNQPRHEVTVTDCFQGKIYCAACGNVYHRFRGQMGVLVLHQ